MSRNALPALALALALGGCATTGFTPDQSMDPARAGLRPEYGVFYDALKNDGDWVLIEPFGFVFRPRVNFVGWQPYQEGFWVPSDIYGWIWVSSEPFGWATYHYGRWLYDAFQGWVWVPGLEWGPAWVAWQANQDLVGWAPLGPSGYGSPRNAFTYLPMANLPDPEWRSRSMRQPPATAEPLARLQNPALIEGVRIERGPPLAQVEKSTGLLPRVELKDLVAPGALDLVRARADSVQAMQATERAARDAAAEARRIVQAKARPARVPVVRPVGLGEDARKNPRTLPARRAPPDTLDRR